MTRWITMAVLVGSLFGIVVFDRIDRAPEPVVEPMDPVDPVPALVEPAPLSEAWLCPLAASPEAVAATVVLTNAGTEPAMTALTVYGADGAGPSVQIEVGPQDVELVPVSDLTDESQVGIGVEARGGEIVVSHRFVIGEETVDGVCATETSETWFLPGGATTRDRTELLVVLNPYPTDVVFSLTFRTELREREPSDLESTTVAARSVRVFDVSEAVAREAVVATELQTVSGGVVVERLSVANGDLGPVGADLELGVPEARNRWYFPAGRVDSHGTHEIVVRNPTDALAEVDIELWPIDNATRAAQGLTPIPVTIRPGGVEVVDLTEVAGQFGWPDPLSFGVVVLTDNVSAVVAERRVVRPVIDTTLIGAGGTEAGDGDGDDAATDDETGAEEETASEDAATEDETAAEDAASEDAAGDEAAAEFQAEGDGTEPPALAPGEPTAGTKGLALSRGTTATATRWIAPSLAISGGTLRLEIMAPDGATVSAYPVVAGIPGATQEVEMDTATQNGFDFTELEGEVTVVVESDRPVVAEVTVIQGDTMRRVHAVPVLVR